MLRLATRAAPCFYFHVSFSLFQRRRNFNVELKVIFPFRSTKDGVEKNMQIHTKEWAQTNQPQTFFIEFYRFVVML